MPGRRLVPPPERVSWIDYYRLGLGVLMIVMGIAILVRAVSAGVVTTAALMMGLAFVAFGVYRLYVGVVRFRIYRQRQTPSASRDAERRT